ncbi:MarR family winged helix-turn-helix transcriptional regulator [Paenibacillus chibensis]|uniref:MarR family winged helix-turn-helix transcriptional regulator n=1 Tax=Paenibacillus chibensis TaxID=59846 RepID=UPI0013E39536|nr:MarR family transcriptional regulator [Paenibacillus chibensis]MEC0372688.1 MarR family transcriptional regulator [Paenibacillus chibensis]
MRSSSKELANRYCELMDRLPRLIDYTGIVRQMKLSTTEAFILQYLQNNGSQRGTDIVKVTGLTTSAITQICDKLVQEELIERNRSETDRRYVNITITAKGTHVLKQLSDLSSERIVETVENFTAEETDELLDIIRQLGELIEFQRKHHD